MHLFFNALAASAGAGLTYVRNIIPVLSARADTRATIALSPQLHKEFGEFPNVTFLEIDVSGTARRFWQEQSSLPELVRRSGAGALVSTGNFALHKAPVPQILLSGNSLYTSSDFYRDLCSRKAYGLWFETRLRALFARRSILWADGTVAPSQSFAEELQRWTGRSVTSIYHGFDHAAFFRDESCLPAEMQQKILSAEGTLKLLFVSHYNYYRNFETLFRALPLIRAKLQGRKVRLFLTCKLQSGENPGSYRAEAAAALVRALGISEEVVELGTVPYHLLHHLYGACDIYVTPAYAETFAHPLVEAMASGLPVVASNLPVHQEICGKAAIYFERFSADGLSAQILQVACSRDLARNLGECGKLRSQDFSWTQHLQQLVSLAQSLIAARNNPKS